MSGEIGYISVSGADAYFATRLASEPWTTIPADSTHAKKIAALTTAYDRLFYSGSFDLPALASASAPELVLLQKAQCEMALYMLINLADEDRRKGLQAQGVTQAGIVKEWYEAGAALMALPIPPFVALILDDYSAADSELYVSSVDRDEDEDSMKL